MGRALTPIAVFVVFALIVMAVAGEAGRRPDDTILLLKIGSIGIVSLFVFSSTMAGLAWLIEKIRGVPWWIKKKSTTSGGRS